MFLSFENGEMMRYEIKYYTKKDLEAFYRYIEAETGLKFLINEKRLVGKRKHLRQRTLAK